MGQAPRRRGVDFDSVADKTVDVKDFRSALFAVKVVELPPGGEVKISMRLPISPVRLSSGW